MDTKTLEKSVLEKIPAIPYLVDQVGAAMDWTRESLSEDDYRKVLKVTINVANYCMRTSEANFFKTHLVIGSLISNIDDVFSNEKFKMFDTASKAVERTCKDIIVPEEDTLANGCFKALSMHLVPLARKDQESLSVMLYGILQDLKDISDGILAAGEKTAITAADYVTVLGYAWTIQNLTHANLNLYNDTSAIINEILILLNKLNF